MSHQDLSSNKNVQGHDFVSKFNKISNKLKKRFLRKPNVAEVVDQFEALAATCEYNDLHQYAASCYLAAARCQGTLGNPMAEIVLLTKAGRQFLAAERKNVGIGCISFNQEDLQGAINAFSHALARLENQDGFNVMSAGLALELSIALGANSEGVEFLTKAVDAHPTIYAINELVSYYIKQGDFVSALNTLNELVQMIESHVGLRITGYYKSILHQCEISRVLLLLILKPTPHRLAPSLAQVLEKYAWAEDTSMNVPNMTEDEILLLQSLVQACQSEDYEGVLELESELWIIFDSEQKELLRILIKTFRK